MAARPTTTTSQRATNLMRYNGAWLTHPPSIVCGFNANRGELPMHDQRHLTQDSVLRMQIAMTNLLAAEQSAAIARAHSAIERAMQSLREPDGDVLSPAKSMTELQPKNFLWLAVTMFGIAAIIGIVIFAVYAVTAPDPQRWQGNESACAARGWTTVYSGQIHGKFGTSWTCRDKQGRMFIVEQ